MKNLIFIFIMFFAAINLSAQEKTFTSLIFGYQAGKVLPTHEFLLGENATGKPIDYFHAFRLEFAWQTNGTKIWHQIYNNPSYGIGLYGANFFNEAELGTPSAVFGFFNWPFTRYADSYFSIELGFGLAYDWREFNLTENPYNLTIGASRSVYIDGGIKYTYELSDHWNLSGMISFSHFSNGSTQQPNAGINLLAPKIEAAYRFQKEKPALGSLKIPEFKPFYEWFIYPTYGSKSEIFDIHNSTADVPKIREAFPVTAIITGISRQISYKSKWTIGTDLVYDKSLEVSYEEIDGNLIKRDGNASDKIRWGIFGMYELVIHNLSGMFGIGYYLKGEAAGQIKKFYQRLGVRYNIFNHFFVGLNLRFFDFGKADHMEYNVGYRTRIYW